MRDMMESPSSDESELSEEAEDEEEDSEDEEEAEPDSEYDEDEEELIREVGERTYLVEGSMLTQPVDRFAEMEFTLDGASQYEEEEPEIPDIPGGGGGSSALSRAEAIKLWKNRISNLNLLTTAFISQFVIVQINIYRHIGIKNDRCFAQIIIGHIFDQCDCKRLFLPLCP